MTIGIERQEQIFGITLHREGFKPLVEKTEVLPKGKPVTEINRSRRRCYAIPLQDNNGDTTAIRLVEETVVCFPSYTTNHNQTTVQERCLAVYEGDDVNKQGLTLPGTIEANGLITSCVRLVDRKIPRKNTDRVKELMHLFKPGRLHFGKR